MYIYIYICVNKGVDWNKQSKPIQQLQQLLSSSGRISPLDDNGLGPIHLGLLGRLCKNKTPNVKPVKRGRSLHNSWVDSLIIQGIYGQVLKRIF